MNVIPYFICFAAGMIVDAVYHQRSKIAEQKAYDRGYNKGRKQALKETEKKLEEVTEEPKNEIELIPEEFMDDLRANGKAVWRRCK